VEKRCDLVFEGGGMKGIGLVGALSVLEEHGHSYQRLAGTSAGAIVAALTAAGYSSAELYETLLSLDFTAFMDEGWEDRLPLIDKPASLIMDLGIYEGDALERWIGERLAAKGVRTFGDLIVDAETDDPRYRWKLQVVVSDVSMHRLLVLPRDARVLGVEPDDMVVAEAVRASMSIPVFFEPKRVKDEGSLTEHVLVDGGMLSNFPVWLFDAEREPRWPTIGLLLVEGDTRQRVGPGVEPVGQIGHGPIALVSYVRALVQTLVEAHDRLYIDQADFARTIPIETLGVAATDFALPEEQRRALYESGRRAAEGFLPFDFDAYQAAFPRGARVSRRDSIRRAMLVHRGGFGRAD